MMILTLSALTSAASASCALARATTSRAFRFVDPKQFGGLCTKQRCTRIDSSALGRASTSFHAGMEGSLTPESAAMSVGQPPDYVQPMQPVAKGFGWMRIGSSAAPRSAATTAHNCAAPSVTDELGVSNWQPWMPLTQIILAAVAPACGKATSIASPSASVAFQQ